jgi:hypothetical protein
MATTKTSTHQTYEESLASRTPNPDKIIVDGTTRDNELSYNGTSLKTLAAGMATKFGIAESRYFGDYNASGDYLGYMNSFNRYFKIFPSDEMGNLISYVFIVRPDCNLDDAIAKDGYFHALSQQRNSPLIGLEQQREGLNITHHFIPFLVDRTLNFQVPDINLKTYDFEQPFSTYRTTYAGNTNESMSGSSFEIQFRENAELDITNFFNAWVKYISGVTTNRFIAKRKYIEAPLTQGTAVFDYATSIYFIRTKADGSEIVFYHKQVGVFPTTIPISNWSYSGPSGTVDNTIGVSFSGGYPESFNPYLLAEFNYNAGVTTVDTSTYKYSVPDDSSKESIIFRNSGGNMYSREGSYDYENPIAGVPFITCDHSKGKFYLRWAAPY